MKIVTDPRNPRRKKHDIAEVLVCLISGYLAGRTSIRRALRWCETHIELLREELVLENGIASVPTASRILSSINEEDFVCAFMQWMTELIDTKDKHIIIDGKALRGATKRLQNGNTPYVLNAIEAVTNLVVAQLAIEEKENEITAIPKLLELLNLRGSILTIDAIGTAENIVQEIVKQDAHYLLQVKKNQPITYDEIMQYFNTHIINEKNIYSINEKNRDRKEYRTIKASEYTSWLTMKERFPGVRKFAMLEQVRIKIEKDETGKDITPEKSEFLKNGTIRKPKINTGDQLTDDVYRVGLLTDVAMSAEKMLDTKRKHWQIENGLHYVLDVTLREDRSPAKSSKNNLALLRKIVYNILQIAKIRENFPYGFPEMMDAFADDSNNYRKYVLKGIPSFY